MIKNAHFSRISKVPHKVRCFCFGLSFLKGRSRIVSGKKMKGSRKRRRGKEFAAKQLVVVVPW